MSEKKTNDDLVANTPDEDISDVDSDIDSDIDNNSDSESEINEDNDDDDEEDNEDENEDDDEDKKEKEVKSVTDVVPSLANDDIINTDNQSLGLLEDSSDDEDETLYEKFDDEMRERVIEEFHPELQSHNYSEITVLSKTVRNSDGIIVDELHQTTPIMSKFEYTRILGMREKQLNDAKALRRATLVNKVPYCTNMSTAQVCIEGIKSLKNKKLTVASLQEIKS